jgi:putative transposase
MPRQKRALSPTHIYHIMVRGNSGRDIFLDDDDREKLLKIISNKKRENEFILYAYCLMDNHFHLVLKEQKDNISHIMKRINITYVVYFNKKYQQNGHLFQDRFKSENVESDDYLLALVRYVHNNPLKAALVDFPQDYQWSSFLNYTCTDSRYKLVQTEDILRLFSEDFAKSVSQFIEFSLAEENKYNFLEYKEDDKGKREINTFSKASYFRDRYLERNKLTLESLSEKQHKVFRDKLIREFKSKSIYSDREIAEFLNIGRGMVQQVGRQE